MSSLEPVREVRDLTEEEIQSLRVHVETIERILSSANQPMVFLCQTKSESLPEFHQVHNPPTKHNFDFLDAIEDFMDCYIDRCPKVFWPDGTRFKRIHAVDIAKKIGLPTQEYANFPTEESLQTVRKMITALSEADKNKHTIRLKIPVSKSSDRSFVNDVGKGTTPGMRYA